MKRIITRLLVVTLSTALALGAVELVIRVRMPQRLNGAWLQESGGGYDVNRPLAAARHTFATRDVQYRINELGFRGPSPGASPNRVLVLGDSVTFGLLLREDDTYVAGLQTSADREWGAGRVALMNAAVGGWGSAEYLAFLEDRASSLSPLSAVLVFLSGDEPRRAWNSGLWRLADGRLQRQPRIRRGPALRSLNRIPGYLFLIERSHLATLARRIVINSSVTPAPPNPPPDDAQVAQTIADGVALNDAILRRLHAWCAERRLPLLVIATGFVNLHGRTADERNEAAMNRRFMNRAGAFFSTLNTPFLDLTGAVEQTYLTPDTYYIPGDYHPTEAATRLVADLSWSWLKQQLAPHLK